MLLLDEPTRGIDVGAKAEIFELMDRLADEGWRSLFATSELEEVLRRGDAGPRHGARTDYRASRRDGDAIAGRARSGRIGGRRSLRRGVADARA